MKQEFLPDEKLEAMLNRLRPNTPNIRCPSGNKINRLCISVKCKNALRCADEECKDCGKKLHKLCGFVPFDYITDAIYEQTDSCKSFVMKMLEIEQTFINNIRRTQQQFIYQFGMGFSEEKYVLLIKSLYEAQQYKGINGEDIQELCGALDVDSDKSFIEFEQDKLEKYRQWFEQFFSYYEYKKSKIILSPLPKPQIDSNILREKGNIEQDTNYIRKMLKHPQRIQLLFRASEHNFNAQAFHKHCNNINDTFVIARTEFGKTIAGFTHYKWNQAKNASVNDAGRRAFLLQLDLQEKMVPVSNYNLIYCQRDKGPLFGGWSPDFGMRDSCNTNNSYGGFPTVQQRRRKQIYPRARKLSSIYRI